MGRKWNLSEGESKGLIHAWESNVIILFTLFGFNREYPMVDGWATADVIQVVGMRWIHEIGRAHAVAHAEKQRYDIP